MRSELVSENGWLVHHLCKKYRFMRDYEDLVQEGFIGLCESSERFVAGGEVKFSTFAYLRVRGSVIDYINRKSRLIRTPVEKEAFEFLSLDAPLFGDDGDLCMVDVIADAGVDGVFDRIIVDEFVSGLEDFEKIVFRLLAAGLSFREVSKRLRLPVREIEAVFNTILCRAGDFGAKNGYKKSCISDAAMI